MKVLLLVPRVHFYAPLALQELFLRHPDLEYRAYLTPKLPADDRFLGGVRDVVRRKGIRYLWDQVSLRTLYLLLSRGESLLGRTLEERRWMEVSGLLSECDVPVVRAGEEGWDSLHEDLREWEPDVLLSIFFNRIIPPGIHRLPDRGSYNLHPGRLPQFRGTAPVFRQLQQGVSEAGCALHELTDELDAGPVLDQKTVEVSSGDTVYRLYRRLARSGGELLAGFVETLRSGEEPSGVPQNEDRARTYEGFDRADYEEFLRDYCWWSLEDFRRS